MIKRTERGWAGHFICGHQCRFRRNTLLECGDVRIIVSTVGAMERGGKIETIGYHRFYETMAFHAAHDGEYWDADVSREVGFESPWAIDDKDRPGVDNEADAMHEVVVAEISARLVSGSVSP